MYYAKISASNFLWHIETIYDSVEIVKCKNILTTILKYYTCFFQEGILQLCTYLNMKAANILQFVQIGARKFDADRIR